MKLDLLHPSAFAFCVPLEVDYNEMNDRRLPANQLQTKYCMVCAIQLSTVWYVQDVFRELFVKGDPNAHVTSYGYVLLATRIWYCSTVVKSRSFIFYFGLLVHGLRPNRSAARCVRCSRNSVGISWSTLHDARGTVELGYGWLSLVKTTG